MQKFWLYDKHKDEIEYTEFTGGALRFKIDADTKFKFNASDDNPYNTVYDWNYIEPSYGFFFDFDANEEIIKEQLNQSKLKTSPFIYMETQSDIPIIRARTEYFIANWFDFISANAEQGSICITDDFKLLLEFTDDCKYYLFSNFMITPDTVMGNISKLCVKLILQNIGSEKSSDQVVERGILLDGNAILHQMWSSQKQSS